MRKIVSSSSEVAEMRQTVADLQEHAVRQMKVVNVRALRGVKLRLV